MPGSIDSTDVSSITIDGTEVTEVTMDGDIVWSASTYLYNEGSEPYAWSAHEVGFGSGTSSKNSDHLYMYVDGGGNVTEHGFDTQQIDLSPYDKIKVDWDVTIADTDNRAYLSIDDANYDVADTLHWVSSGTTNGRTITTLDVSGYNNSYYVETDALADGGGEVEQSTYAVWLE